jgi:hypothetical protein
LLIFNVLGYLLGYCFPVSLCNIRRLYLYLRKVKVKLLLKLLTLRALAHFPRAPVALIMAPRRTCSTCSHAPPLPPYIPPYTTTLPPSPPPPTNHRETLPDLIQ